MTVREEVFREVFKEIRFPYFAVDLVTLRRALEEPEQGTGSYFVVGTPRSSERRSAFVSGIRGFLSQIDVPPKMAQLFASSAYLASGGYGKKLLRALRGRAPSLISEREERIWWEEGTLWPLAYRGFLTQFFELMGLHQTAIEQRIQEVGSSQIISEYPRHLPTRLHYAAASLGAWLGGAINLQYFGLYAAERQIVHSDLNLKYAERIGFDHESASGLDQSGIIFLPEALVVPLIDAQGSAQVFGSISVDEFNDANPPKGFPLDSVEGRERRLPGLLVDKYYRAPFFARKPEGYALYGCRDVLRNHYQQFYGEIKREALVRCKHYCAPIVEVSSSDELRHWVGRIPIRSKEGLYFRGQRCLYPLKRHALAKNYLFGDSCSAEPSLVTSASREAGYDYDVLHFALKYFLQLKVLENPGAIEKWQTKGQSPVCEVDFALLALAQHYGLPSHGLDVTLDSGIALWFATNLFVKDEVTRIASYKGMSRRNWPPNPAEWPVVLACQSVTHSIHASLHDCHQLEEFGFRAERPLAQKAKFFQGGHSDHQNRLAEALVCVFRLAPGDYDTASTFETLFPGPDKDPAYRTMLEFADSEDFGPVWGKYVNRFHRPGR